MEPVILVLGDSFVARLERFVGHTMELQGSQIRFRGIPGATVERFVFDSLFLIIDNNKAYETVPLNKLGCHRLEVRTIGVLACWLHWQNSD